MSFSPSPFNKIEFWRESMTVVLALPASELTLWKATWMFYQSTGSCFNSWLFFWSMNNRWEKWRVLFVSHKPWIWCMGLWFKWSPGSMAPASHSSLSEEDIPMFCVRKCMFGEEGAQDLKKSARAAHTKDKNVQMKWDLRGDTCWKVIFHLSPSVQFFIFTALIVSRCDWRLLAQVA